jgi:hypothetical protein
MFRRYPVQVFSRVLAFVVVFPSSLQVNVNVVDQDHFSDSYVIIIACETEQALQLKCYEVTCIASDERFDSLTVDKGTLRFSAHAVLSSCGPDTEQ